MKNVILEIAFVMGWACTSCTAFAQGMGGMGPPGDYEDFGLLLGYHQAEFYTAGQSYAQGDLVKYQFRCHVVLRNIADGYTSTIELVCIDTSSSTELDTAMSTSAAGKHMLEVEWQPTGLNGADPDEVEYELRIHWTEDADPCNTGETTLGVDLIENGDDVWPGGCTNWGLATGITGAWNSGVAASDGYNDILSLDAKFHWYRPYPYALSVNWECRVLITMVNETLKNDTCQGVGLLYIDWTANMDNHDEDHLLVDGADTGGGTLGLGLVESSTYDVRTQTSAVTESPPRDSDFRKHTTGDFGSPRCSSAIKGQI